MHRKRRSRPKGRALFYKAHPEAGIKGTQKTFSASVAPEQLQQWGVSAEKGQADDQPIRC